MRKALALSLLTVFLGGCANEPAHRDVSGIWINQAAIDAAAQGGNLREALLTYGPNLEWDIDTQRAQARYTNGFERVEGKLQPEDKGVWQVNFYGSTATALSVEGDELIQAAADADPQQSFVRSRVNVMADDPLGTSFEKALKAAYLGGPWRIQSGTGQGGTVTFSPGGQLTGLPGMNAYALCLAGDCASMSGEYDSLWLQLGQEGNEWIFVRDGDQLQIFEALNRAQPDEMPDLHPGPQRWLLERD